MIDLDADVAIVGAGFGGSLTALILHSIGLKPVLIDRGSHPRFAIGESSTPAADLVLRNLATRYGLSKLLPLTQYGTWRVAYPDVACGLKRGFSYFQHEPNREFVPQSDHANELLVAASSSDSVADTHWFRADVDALFAAEVIEAGIPFFDCCSVAPTMTDQTWLLEGDRHNEPIRIRAGFLIDASGSAGFLANALGLSTAPTGMHTRSRALFGHFLGVRSWHEVLKENGAETADHPFHCDHAAVHHLLEEGWMWQLHFDNGITSAGFVLDSEHDVPGDSFSAEEEWQSLIGRYPSLQAQFQSAQLAESPGTLIRTNRLQRRAEKIVGSNWALLPHSAGFVDPLHSTGIAQTLCGIERLMRSFEQFHHTDRFESELKHYEQSVWAEFDLIDQLVHGCYLSRHRFRVFAAYSMLYFAAATTSERRRVQQEEDGVPGAFLLADDSELRTIVDRSYDRVCRLTSASSTAHAEAAFETEVREAIAPFNQVGLCDPDAHNMYRYTAAEK